MADTLFDRTLKDIGEVHGRLFIHRPFVQGEIKFLMKEFEEKRNEREVQNLFEILENVTEIRETHADKAMKLGDIHLCHVTANLEVALRMCSNIAEREDTLKKKAWLDKQRESRKQEWIAFIDDIQAKNSLVNKMFDDKEKELKNYYCKLEEVMHLPTDH